MMVIEEIPNVRKLSKSQINIWKKDFRTTDDMNSGDVYFFPDDTNPFGLSNNTTTSSTCPIKEMKLRLLKIGRLQKW